MSPSCFNFVFCSSSSMYRSTMSHSSCSLTGSISSIGKESGSPIKGLKRKYFVEDIFDPPRAFAPSPNTSCQETSEYDIRMLLHKDLIVMWIETTAYLHSMVDLLCVSCTIQNLSDNSIPSNSWRDFDFCKAPCPH